MATAVDPLRSTLDSLHLSPEAKADRPYLESMLRRLGYSQAEIEAYFQSNPAPSPAGAPADPDDRLIEIEYTGPGLRDFAFVEPVDASELQTGLGAGLTAGEEVISAGPSMDDVDALMEQQGLGDFGDEGFQQQAQDDVVFAKGPGEEEDAPAGEGGEGEGAESGPAGEGAEPAAGAEEAKAKEDEFTLGEGMVEFQEMELQEAVTAPIPDPSTEGWQEVATPQPGDAAAATEPAWQGEMLPEAAPIPDVEAIRDEPEEWEVVAEPPAPSGFQYNDWTLYSKEQDGPDGSAQRIYFFSKGEPTDADPAEMPPGYEVAENPRTGLPYLRRIGEEETDPGDIRQVGNDPQRGKKKRVRVKRVRAASKEEAERKVSEAGGNPLTTMPIDIEERWDQ